MEKAQYSAKRFNALLSDDLLKSPAVSPCLKHCYCKAKGNPEKEIKGKGLVINKWGTSNGVGNGEQVKGEQVKGEKGKRNRERRNRKEGNKKW